MVIISDSRETLPVTEYWPELIGLADDDLFRLLLAGVVLEHVLVNIITNLEKIVNHRLIGELVNDLKQIRDEQ
jgi:hypothetical protein